MAFCINVSGSKEIELRFKPDRITIDDIESILKELSVIYGGEVKTKTPIVIPLVQAQHRPPTKRSPPWMHHRSDPGCPTVDDLEEFMEKFVMPIPRIINRS
jgi:hypothetical protein